MVSRPETPFALPFGSQGEPPRACLPNSLPTDGRRTVLVIDDEPSIRESLGRVLRAEQLKVIATAGGRQALEYLLNPQIALVITDLRMAPIDGCDFIFFARIGRPCLPVFVLTGVSPQTSGGADRLATEYFQKPVNLDLLLLAVRKQLQLSLSP